MRDTFAWCRPRADETLKYPPLHIYLRLIVAQLDVKFHRIFAVAPARTVGKGEHAHYDTPKPNCARACRNAILTIVG